MVKLEIRFRAENGVLGRSLKIEADAKGPLAIGSWYLPKQPQKPSEKKASTGR